MQLDEPWLQARPDAARRYGVKAINRALEGVNGTTAVHLCFGYAALVKDKPERLLVPRRARRLDARSRSRSRPRSRSSISACSGSCRGKTIMLGVIDLGDRTSRRPTRSPRGSAPRSRYVPPERLIAAPDCGMKYLARETAFGKLQALAAGTALVRRELA